MPAEHPRRCDVRITVEDLVDGSTETTEIPPDGYAVIVGARMEIAGEQIFSNGTRIITLKRRPPS